MEYIPNRGMPRKDSSSLVQGAWVKVEAGERRLPIGADRGRLVDLVEDLEARLAALVPVPVGT